MANAPAQDITNMTNKRHHIQNGTMYVWNMGGSPGGGVLGGQTMRGGYGGSAGGDGGPLGVSSPKSPASRFDGIDTIFVIISPILFPLLIITHVRKTILV